MTPSTRHIIGIDDAPFPPDHRGDVTIVGAVFGGDRLDGVITGQVRRDGANATDRIASMIGESRFVSQLHAILLQGIALAGFNVVDIVRLHRMLARPVIAVARRRPDAGAVRRALLERVPGGKRKWRLIDRAGPMESAAGVWIQRAGIAAEPARKLLDEHIRHGALPEPLRTAHLIASALGHRPTRQRA